MTSKEIPAVKDLKDAESRIKKDIDDKKIDDNEIKNTDKVTDFLKNNNDPKIKEGIENIWKKYKDKVRDAIINYFDIKIVDDPKNVGNKQAIIDLSTKNSLTPKTMIAYINTLNWATSWEKKENNENDRNVQLIVNTLNTKINDANISEKKVESQTEDKQLFELLSSDPSIDNAKELFGDAGDQYKSAREAIFNHTENGEFKIQDDVKWNNEKKNKSPVIHQVK